MWYSTAGSPVTEKGHLKPGNTPVSLSIPLKLHVLGLVFLLGTGGASVAQETPTLEHKGERITFFTSDVNVQTIIQEQVDSPSIDEAITKVIPNHLILYRSNNGNHMVHTVIEITDDAKWADASQVLLPIAKIRTPAVKPEPPQVFSPSAGSSVNGKQAKIMWNAGNRAISKWQLYVGTNENGKNLLDSGDMSSETKSYLINNLPEDGSTINVKLRYQERGNSAWRSTRTTFISTEVPYSSNLIALYNFDGDLTDASGNGLHGRSPTPLAFRSTPDGRSTVHFDGVDDHIVLGRSGKLDFSAARKFTIATWVKLPATSPLFSNNEVSMNLISRYDRGIAGEYYLDLRKSGRVGLLRETAPFDKQSSSKIIPNQFSFVVGTYDGSVARVYVDGVLSGSTAMGPSRSASNTDVVLGARHKRGKLENFFQGEMDKLLIYDRALTDAEILSMYSAN